MSSFRSKPVGWRYESYRHYLASKGVSTKLPTYELLFNKLDKLSLERKEAEAGLRTIRAAKELSPAAGVHLSLEEQRELGSLSDIDREERMIRGLMREEENSFSDSEDYMSRKYQASMVQRAPDSMTLKQRVKNLFRPISRDESEYRDMRNEKVVSFIPLSDVKVKSLLEDERQFTPEEKLNEVARVRFERLQRGHVNVLSPEKRLMLVPGDVVERRFVREIVPLSDKERLRRTLELRDSKYHGRAFDPVVGDLVYGQDVLRRDDD